jgi:hypothetical protein
MRGSCWRAVRTESPTVITTPLHVTIQAHTAVVTTNNETGRVSSRTRLEAATTMLTAPHRYVSRLKSLRMPGLHCTSGVSGQKSAANRVINGLPTATEPRNSAAVSTVRRIGWAK